MTQSHWLVDKADVTNVTELFLSKRGQQQGGVVWKGNEMKGLAGKHITASEACARRTCRTCSTSCSSPVGHVCAVSMPRWPKAAMMLPLALLNVLGLRFTPQTIRPSNAPGHTPSDVSMHRCHSTLLPCSFLLIVTKTLYLLSNDLWDYNMTSWDHKHADHVPAIQSMLQMHLQSHKPS